MVNEKEKIKRRLKYLEQKMSQVGHVMRGTVVNVSTKCGNPNCKCAKGEKHLQEYFSLNKDKKTIWVFLGRHRAEKAKTYIDNYKKTIDLMEEMTILNLRLLKMDKSKKTN
jgi:hypothetical protein